MARISTYPLDTLDKNDKLFGTSSDGGTKNFKIGPEATGIGGASSTTILNYISEADPKALAFVFHNATYANNGSMQAGTINVTGTAVNKSFDDVTTLKVSKFPFATTLQSSPQAAVQILNEYVGERIKWSDSENPNIYGIYECLSFTQDGSTDFYDMGLQYVSHNGNFTAGNNTTTTPDIYMLELFGTDKHYTHEQGSAASVWNVTHYLNKFPSVTIKLADGQQVEADVSHINKTSLTITFSSSNSGTAYMN